MPRANSHPTATRAAPGVRRSDRRDLASGLQQLGFTDYEAQAYIALTRAHPSTAYEVAKMTGLPRANVYSVLRSLETKGAIQPVTKNPVRYVPRDSSAFFNQIEKRTATLCSDVIRGLSEDARTGDDVYVWVFRGESEVREKIASLISCAHSRVWIKAPARLVQPYLPLLVGAAARGVEVILILFDADIDAFRRHAGITAFLHEGDGSSHGTAADVMLTMAVDSTDVLIASQAGETLASHARNPSIVYVIQTLLLHEIYICEIFDAFGPELVARFGSRLLKLRKKYRPRGMELAVLGGTMQ
jgi:HTH-type transcriptional regulator, sugar sensing transcriptional regulator